MTVNINWKKFLLTAELTIVTAVSAFLASLTVPGATWDGKHLITAAVAAGIALAYKLAGELSAALSTATAPTPAPPPTPPAPVAPTSALIVPEAEKAAA